MTSTLADVSYHQPIALQTIRLSKTIVPVCVLLKMQYQTHRIEFLLPMRFVVFIHSAERKGYIAKNLLLKQKRVSICDNQAELT